MGEKLVFNGPIFFKEVNIGGVQWQAIGTIEDLDIAPIKEEIDKKFSEEVTKVLTTNKEVTFTAKVDYDVMFNWMWELVYKHTKLVAINPDLVEKLGLGEPKGSSKGLNTRFIISPYLSEEQSLLIEDKEIKKEIFELMHNNKKTWYEYDWEKDILNLT